jgi:hypothetical protein
MLEEPACAGEVCGFSFFLSEKHDNFCFFSLVHNHVISYNKFMKWLLIAGKDSMSSVDAIQIALDEYKAPRVVYNVESAAGSLKDLDKDVLAATHVIVLNAETALLLRSALFFTGYLIGKKLPVFFTGAVPSEVCYSSESHVAVFLDVDSLVKAIHDNFPKYIAEEKKQIAHDTLFNEGVPFTPDFFAFHIAANHERLCKLFLEAGLDANSCDAAGTPMLCMAARHNRKELLEWLLAEGSDVDAISKDRGYTAVMDAVWKTNTSIVKILVAKKADLNVISRDGQSVLILAVGTGSEEICQLLAENGADPMIKDSMGMSAIEYAHLFKKESIAALLEKYAK